MDLDLKELCDYGYFDLFDKNLMVDINVDLMLDKFSKHWLNLKDVFAKMGAPEDVYLRTLKSSVISLNRYTYYSICDLGQIDLSNCILSGESILEEDDIEEEYSFGVNV